MKFKLSSYHLIDKYNLSLSELYDKDDLSKFHKRFELFSSEIPLISKITKLSNNTLSYLSESYLLPPLDDRKPNIIIVLGNPSPDSIVKKSMFAYENNGRKYHRFWEVLHETGILKFFAPPAYLNPQQKMEALFSRAYISPFNVFILPFYSFATPPGGLWAGVAGLKKFFGKAFKAVEQFELDRVKSFFKLYLKDGDNILVFQKDAFIALNQNLGDPNKNYNYHSLLKNPITSNFHLGIYRNLTLTCMLPTRLLHSKTTKNTLKKLADIETL